MLDILSIVLLIVGSVFLFLAALGLLRMPDVFLRMSSTTKGATLGVGAVLLGAALYFNDLAVGVQALATVAFVLLTTPVAAHMIGRAAYFDGSPLFQNILFDELCDRYNAATHALDSRPCGSTDDEEMAAPESASDAVALE